MLGFGVRLSMLHTFFDAVPLDLAGDGDDCLDECPPPLPSVAFKSGAAVLLLLFDACGDADTDADAVAANDDAAVDFFGEVDADLLAVSLAAAAAAAAFFLFLRVLRRRVVVFKPPGVESASHPGFADD